MSEVASASMSDDIATVKDALTTLERAAALSDYPAGPSEYRRALAALGHIEERMRRWQRRALKALDDLRLMRNERDALADAATTARAYLWHFVSEHADDCDCEPDKAFKILDDEAFSDALANRAPKERAS